MTWRSTNWRFQLAGLVAGLATALAGALLNPTEPDTVTFIDHATVIQCSR